MIRYLPARQNRFYQHQYQEHKKKGNTMAIAEIKINKDKTLKIDSSVGWIIKYREQFGRDILPELLPLISAGVELTLKTMEDAGQSADQIGRASCRERV